VLRLGPGRKYHPPGPPPVRISFRTGDPRGTARERSAPDPETCNLSGVPRRSGSAADGD